MRIAAYRITNGEGAHHFTEEIEQENKNYRHLWQPLYQWHPPIAADRIVAVKKIAGLSTTIRDAADLTGACRIDSDSIALCI